MVSAFVLAPSNVTTSKKVKTTRTKISDSQKKGLTKKAARRSGSKDIAKTINIRISATAEMIANIKEYM
jgi:hypothetical protein